MKYILILLLFASCKIDPTPTVSNNSYGTADSLYINIHSDTKGIKASFGPDSLSCSKLGGQYIMTVYSTSNDSIVTVLYRRYTPTSMQIEVDDIIVETSIIQ